jgi:hypothetical protein
LSTLGSFSEKVNMALQGLLRASVLANSSSFRKVKTLEHVFKNRIDFAILNPEPVKKKLAKGGFNKPDFQTFKNAFVSS